MAGPRQIRLRYRGECLVCRNALPAGTRAWWDPDRKTVRCTGCQEPTSAPAAESSRAGSSAQREALRRKANDERRFLERHPHVGRCLLPVRTTPQHVTAWERGAAGERKLGALLETLASERIRVLHDRRIPGTVANIDHIVVSPSGTYIIDAKNYGGRVEQRDKGGFLRSDFRLYVAGRDRTRLVEAMDRQAEAVKAAAGNDVTVIPVLCFVASRGLLQRPFSVNGVVVTWPRDLVRRIARLERPASDVPEIASQLEAALPPA